MDAAQIVISSGAVGVFLIVFAALLRGDLRTKQEVASWQARAERAETLVDDLRPALDRQTISLETMARSVEKLADRIATGRSS